MFLFKVRDFFHSYSFFKCAKMLKVTDMIECVYFGF